MINAIKAIISSRGAQLVARGAAIALTWLAAKAQVALESQQIESSAQVIGLLVAGGLCLLVDFVSHRMQKKAE